MIDLYGISSPNVLKVIIMLEETGLAYDLHRIDIWAADQFTDEFKALNPNSKVPVIVDHDGVGGQPVTLFESGAILFYLAEKTQSFLPSLAQDRYATMQWLMLQVGTIGPMFGQATHFRGSAPAGQEYSLKASTTTRCASGDHWPQHSCCDTWWRQAVQGHGAILPDGDEGCGGARGCRHRSKVSMTIMCPPQQGHGGRMSVGSCGWSSSGGGATAKSSRARAMLALRDEPASRP